MGRKLGGKNRYPMGTRFSGICEVCGGPWTNKGKPNPDQRVCSKSCAGLLNRKGLESGWSHPGAVASRYHKGDPRIADNGNKLKHYHEQHDKALEELVTKLEAQGLRCVVVDGFRSLRPDIIAVPEGTQVYGFEVTNGSRKRRGSIRRKYRRKPDQAKRFDRVTLISPVGEEVIVNHEDSGS